MNTEISKSNICRRALLMIAAGSALASAAVAANASEVKVSSFGYDSEDSTEFIQKVLAYCAQFEREAILTRQRQGIAEAKKRGVRFGRPRRKMPPEFAEAVEMCFVRLAALHSFV